MADLANFKPKSDEIVVTLKIGDEVLTNDTDNSDMTWTLYAPHTKEYKEVQYDLTDQIIERAQGDKTYRPKAKDMAERDFEVLARITKSWNITFNEKKPKLTINKAKELLEDFPFIKEQLEKALEEKEGFT
jgi:hypothetical protein